MIYILAALFPPLGLLLNGQPFSAVFNLLLIVPCFVFARIIQGMGGAMMTPVGRLVLVRSVDRRKLVDAMAWVTMPALIGPIMGPPVGGFITTYATWHWISSSTCRSA